jgi:hypothetical protein
MCGHECAPEPSSCACPCLFGSLGKINYEQKDAAGGWVGEGEQDDGGEGINKEKEIERESPSGFGSDFWS